MNATNPTSSVTLELIELEEAKAFLQECEQAETEHFSGQPDPTGILADIHAWTKQDTVGKLGRCRELIDALRSGEPNAQADARVWLETYNSPPPGISLDEDGEIVTDPKLLELPPLNVH